MSMFANSILVCVALAALVGRAAIEGPLNSTIVRPETTDGSGDAPRPRVNSSHERRVHFDPYLNAKRRETIPKPVDVQLPTSLRHKGKAKTELDMAPAQVTPITFEILDEQLKHHEFMVVLLHTSDSSSCELCPEAFRDFQAACSYIAKHEADLAHEDRRLNFATLDVRGVTDYAKRLRKLNSHENWALPAVLLVSGLHQKSNGHVFAVHPRHAFYQSDLEHSLLRTLHGHMSGFRDEHGLLANVFDVHNDGVTVALFFTPELASLGVLPPHDDLNEPTAAFHDAALDDFLHVHFLVFDAPRDSQGQVQFTPDVQALFDKYNPDKHDVVAFIVDEVDEAEVDAARQRDQEEKEQLQATKSKKRSASASLSAQAEAAARGAAATGEDIEAESGENGGESQTAPTRRAPRGAPTPSRSVPPTVRNDDEDEPATVSKAPHTSVSLSKEFFVEYFDFHQGNEDHDHTEVVHFSNIKALRSFIEHAKAHRHKASKRKFRGVRERIEVTHARGTTKEECGAHGIRLGDKFVASVVGWAVDTHATFLDWTEPRELVAGSHFGHLPPHMEKFAVGWCKGSHFSLHVPAHDGFHAEVYDVVIHDVHRDAHHHTEEGLAASERVAEAQRAQLLEDTHAASYPSHVIDDGIRYDSDL